jgi:hypothetical protein
MNEPNAITDFDGVVTVAQVQGTGTEHGGGRSVPLPFDADMRIFAGRYVGLDSQLHEGTFGFV